jgi:inhibitor of cysteine peptidase
MKKWWILGTVVLAAFAVIAFVSVSQFKIVNAWVGDGKPVVLTNKVWKVQFSEEISEKSLDSSLVYVTNDKGEKLETSLTLGHDQKSIYINPPENGYDTGSDLYTLHFKKGIESVLGRNLLTSHSMHFIVKESLPVIGSKEKLAGYFEEIMKEQEKRRGWFGTSKESSDESATSEVMAGTEKSVSANDVSETNVQVQGVDEADIVKTDGKHIFKAEQNKVQIIKAEPDGQMKLLASINYKDSFSPIQLFLEDGQLVVIGYQHHNLNRPYDQIAKDSLIAPMMQSTKVILYNVENPAEPAKIREIELEGNYVSSRKANGVVYLISNHFPDVWLLKENKEIDMRPKYSDSASDAKEKRVGYNDIRYFPDSREANYTMIAAFDLGQPEKEAAITTYLGSGNQIFMSKENLYLAVSNYTEQPMDERGMIAPDTDIHKFTINGMKVSHHSSAMVQGMVLNQFSMDEHDGFFRLVTTKGYAWDESKPSSNQLYILDGNLKMAGKIEGLARGERIYSARFMGERIYMVTFKETDPLFVIETSDPKNPQVLGELKIPGFSNYLHPYDENHIIGFGQDTKIIAEKSGGTRILTDGVKISMFDVSDMANPKEKFTEIIGGRGTYSPLNHDHKALLFNKKKNLFAFPITVYQNSDKNEYEQIFEYQGAYIYNVDPASGFKLKSKITHIKGQKPVYEEYDSSIQRLLYIGNTLYALSPGKITSHDLKTNAKLGELELR